MKFQWKHAVFAMALGGVLALAPLGAAAQEQPAAQTREARPGTRRDIHQDTRQLRRKRRDIRHDKRQLQAARQRFGPGSPQARSVRRDIHHDKRSTRRLRRDRNRDVRIHQRRMARRMRR